MKRTKPTQPGHPCPDYIHSLPKKLADTLHSKSKDRYTKYDAFHYLMERQAVHTSDQSKNHTRPFTVTITELSVDWGWHRHTVTAFLGLGLARSPAAPGGPGNGPENGLSGAVPSLPENLLERGSLFGSGLARLPRMKGGG